MIVLKKEIFIQSDNKLFSHYVKNGIKKNKFKICSQKYKIWASHLKVIKY